MNNGTFITVAGCWHSMIVVGIVAHTQEFFDKRLNFHQMKLKRLLQVADQHCYSNSNYSIGQQQQAVELLYLHYLHYYGYYYLASFDDGFDAGLIADVVELH